MLVPSNYSRTSSRLPPRVRHPLYLVLPISLLDLRKRLGKATQPGHLALRLGRMCGSRRPSLRRKCPIARTWTGGEIQVVGPEGSALVMDSRIWYSTVANLRPEPRVAIITRYCPWWLSVGIWQAQQCDCAEGSVRGPAGGGQDPLSASGREGGGCVSGVRGMLILDISARQLIHRRL